MALGVRGNLEAELSRLRADVSEAQKQKTDAEKRIASLARKNRDALGLVANLEKRVEALAADKEALNALVASYQNIESEFVVEKKQLRNEFGAVIVVLGKNKAQLEGKLADARGALSKSHNEAFTALESGYNLC